MAISIPIELGYEFSVKAPYKEVFAVLSDVPESVSHFPKVDKLVDLGDGVWRWEMQKIGVGQATLQTVYASRYAADAKKGTVVWTPVKGVGNAQVGGGWTIKDRKSATDLVLKIHGTVDMPLPGLMKGVVGPIVAGEFEKLVDRYVDSLVKRFGGEA
ncbi:MAG TPA: SRPBCC family protein [Burkholderiaceae bacterium]|nr:SRPBCC family protein [Burkholderiaceae bacterium]